MSLSKHVKFKKALMALSLSLFPMMATHAAGMVPDTTLLVIDEAEGGGVMNVKNTDNFPSLLYTTITDLPDDTGTQVNTTQPVVRVEPGQQQQVRFILQTKEPLKVEHYKRVIFEGIPPKNTDKKYKISFNLRQDMPVLIRPKNLPVVTDAWKLLTWSGSGQHLTVKNPSAYVVRMDLNVTYLPSGTVGKLPKTYILPGETMNVTVAKAINADKSVRFSPASRYGIEVPNFTATLTP